MPKTENVPDRIVSRAHGRPMRPIHGYLERIEKHVGLPAVLIAIMVSLGGLAEITPLFMSACGETRA